MDLSDDDDVQIVRVEPQKRNSTLTKAKSKSSMNTKMPGNPNKTVKTKQTSLSWVSSSFDGFDQPKSSFPATPLSKSKTWSTSDKSTTSTLKGFYSQTDSRKRPREKAEDLPSTQSNVLATSSEVWSQKYAPQNKNDLAVHKKKVEEIEDWLVSKASQHSKHRAPILLLTGPPGAGKTACVKLLCREHGYTVQEWSSSSEHTADQWDSQPFQSAERSKVDVYTSQSQSSVFHNFLLRANKYQALDILGSQSGPSSNGPSCHGDSRGCSVIMVEDLPNIFNRDTAQFHEILRKYRYNGHSPIVFVMTESSSNSSSTQRLFPKDLQSQLGILNISVNPVAPTMLTKVLNRVASQEARQSKFATPSPSVTESIAMASGGDIRAALNTLQFVCRRDTSDLSSVDLKSIKNEMKRSNSVSKSKSRGQRQAKSKSSALDISASLGAKDTSVFLFQAVGKILYFKRGDPEEHPDAPTLPDHLQEHHRDPLLVTPEEVASKSHLPGDFFTSFLHENYVEFLPRVDDLVRASEYFSDSDHIAGGAWSARDDLQKYSISIASRGFIHSNSELICHSDKRTNHGWRPLHKSQWFSASKKAAENVVAAQQLFKGYHWEPEVLCTEMIPYISLTNPTLHDTGQISFVQEMTQFPQQRHMFRSNLERLDEKDVVMDSDENEDVSSLSSRISDGGQRRHHQQTEDTLGEETLTASQGDIKGQEEDEEDFVIEDFDD